MVQDPAVRVLGERALAQASNRDAPLAGAILAEGDRHGYTIR